MGNNLLGSVRPEEMRLDSIRTVLMVRAFIVDKCGEVSQYLA